MTVTLSIIFAALVGGIAFMLVDAFNRRRDGAASAPAPAEAAVAAAAASSWQPPIARDRVEPQSLFASGDRDRDREAAPRVHDEHADTRPLDPPRFAPRADETRPLEPPRREDDAPRPAPRREPQRGSLWSGWSDD